MHNAAFAADDLDFVYVCLDVDPDGLPAAVLGLRALKFRGFNVTMPHKRAMVLLVDDLDEGARVSGAVNTVVIEASGMRGYNTDGGGMVMACEEAGIELSGKSVLLLGSGGTASAIAVAFCEAGVGDLYRAGLERSSAEHARIVELGHPELAPYALALGYRIRYILDMNAREAMHLIELRSGREGHPAYRAVAHEMHRLIAEAHPAVGAAMTHVDHEQEPRLERILSEMRTEEKARARAATLGG